MNWPFAIIAFVTVASAIAAMSLRQLVHCALCLTITFAGLAAAYLHLNAQFVGLAQILVYIGAVAILIVFAILLTRNNDSSPKASIVSPSWWVGLGVAVITLGCLAGAVASSVVMKRGITAVPQAAVKQIGDNLLNNYLLPLEVIGLLLTAALIGAVLIAMQERKASS